MIRLRGFVPDTRKDLVRERWARQIARGGGGIILPCAAAVALGFDLARGFNPVGDTAHIIFGTRYARSVLRGRSWQAVLAALSRTLDRTTLRRVIPVVSPFVTASPRPVLAIEPFIPSRPDPIAAAHAANAPPLADLIVI